MKYFAVLLTALLLLLTGCQHDGASTGGGGATPSASPDLVILSGSENKSLEPIVQDYAKQHNLNIRMDYRGSVDIMQALRSDHVDADAVWPANSLWISLGDTKHRVKDAQSIMWSPVVLAVKESVAKRNGWIGKNVSVNDILIASEAKKLKFTMTSATQSNSGACAYLGFLYAFSGKPDVVTSKNLNDPSVRSKIKRILGQVDRSSGSSGWLKDLFLQKYDTYDAMINYEALAIEANQQLVQQGREPLHVIYPSDGLAIADSPLGYIEGGNDTKRQTFEQLQAYLLSAPVQQQILALGRRVGPVGAELPSASKDVYRPEWGISLTKFLNQIRYPKADVIEQALNLYQTAFRKPSYTVYVLDYSGSMEGDREQHLKAAMHNILDQTIARQNMLQSTTDDVTRVIAFSDHVLKEWKVVGNDPTQLAQLDSQVENLKPGGGTDIYTPVMQAITEIHTENSDGKRFPAVILMTDGESNTGMNFNGFKTAYSESEPSHNIPVFGILFGDASASQLQGLSDATSGRTFDGTGDLTTAFRDARGYN